jgi:mRNA-degrading endonuclease RelE of RelBE toxin-antitoxin system
MADRGPPGRLEVSAAAWSTGSRADHSAAIGALPEGDVKLLRGAERLWRLRVAEWRVIFDRRDDGRVIDVLVVRPRGRAYRR